MIEGHDVLPLRPIKADEAARDELASRGVDISEYFHYEAGERRPGLDPSRGRYNSFASLSDPDGNTWLLQEA
jgi:hypothetical protein